MPLKDRFGNLFYTDEDVERLTGISSSKLRTAQRLELAESQSALQHQRHVRVWPEKHVMAAFAAQALSDHLGLPFAVSCCIMVAARAAIPDVSLIHTAVGRRKLPKTSGSGSKLYPVIELIDRKLVFIIREGFHRPLGTLETGEDGRQTFVSSAKIRRPRDGTWQSRCLLDTLPVVRNFSQIIDSA